MYSQYHYSIVTDTIVCNQSELLNLMFISILDKVLMIFCSSLNKGLWHGFHEGYEESIKVLKTTVFLAKISASCFQICSVL